MGLRRMDWTKELVERLLREGTAAAVPLNVPKDLEIVAVKMMPPDYVSLLVSSEEFDGPAPATIEEAKPFVATFRMAEAVIDPPTTQATAPGPKPA